MTHMYHGGDGLCPVASMHYYTFDKDGIQSCQKRTGDSVLFKSGDLHFSVSLGYSTTELEAKVKEAFESALVCYSVMTEKHDRTMSTFRSALNTRKRQIDELTRKLTKKKQECAICLDTCVNLAQMCQKPGCRALVCGPCFKKTIASTNRCINNCRGELVDFDFSDDESEESEEVESDSDSEESQDSESESSGE